MEDHIFGLVYNFVTAGSKPKSLVITKNSSKAVHKYLLQFKRLTFRLRVLQQLCIVNDTEHHKLVLPTVYKKDVIGMFHGGYGHEDVNCTIALAREHFYWNAKH